jgi:hypothetical protein
MAIATPDPWLTGRTWHIVRADLTLAHVFMPLSRFTFEAATSTDGISGYTITHMFQAPVPDFFADIFLRPVDGSEPPEFKAITNKLLPPYNKTSAPEYDDVSELMDTYVEKNPKVRHLESTIMVPCHANCAVAPGKDALSHSPMWKDRTIHVYQFSNAVNGDHPLLLIRTPLSTLCPANGGGTAIGYG